MKGKFGAVVLVFITACAAAQTKPADKAKAPDPATSKGQAPKFQPFNIKTGMWESTTTYTIAGSLPVSQAMLDKMKPEQRARVEAAMKRNAAGNTRTQTDQHCMTKDDLENPINTANKECKWTILESTGTKARANVTCETQGATMNGSGEFEAVDQEHIKGSTHGTVDMGGHTMNVDTNIASKWLSASCSAKE